MLAVGVDIIEIERIGHSLDRLGQAFLDRIFTPREQAYCSSRLDSLAGRFAVKEAVGKAFGTGIGDIRWVEIEILNDENGRPNLILHDTAKELADSLGLVGWSISIAHTKTHAVGMAVAMKTRDEHEK